MASSSVKSRARPEAGKHPRRKLQGLVCKWANPTPAVAHIHRSEQESVGPITSRPIAPVNCVFQLVANLAVRILQLCSTLYSTLAAALTDPELEVCRFV